MELPLVDFSAFLKKEGTSVGEEPTKSQIEVSQSIDAANRKHGFVLLRNSGIPKDLVQKTFQESKTLFELPDSYKCNQLHQWNAQTNTGYFPSESLNRRRGADLKEVFNFKQNDKELTLRNTPNGLRPTLEMFWESAKNSGKKYATACALALGIPIDFFSSKFPDYDFATLRLLHYPPCIDADKVGKQMDLSSPIRVGEHTDFGAFTFLFVKDFHSEDSKGLQVKLKGSLINSNRSDDDIKRNKDSVEIQEEKEESHWRDVVIPDEILSEIKDDETATIIVNTGMLMERWTNDTWTATAHRVIVTEETAPGHRYSIAFFNVPDKSSICKVHEKFITGGTSPKYEPISSIDFLKMKLKELKV